MSNGLAVEIRGLRKQFQKGTETIEVLRGLDFAITPGEVVTILGASGVGKSTLLYIMGALERPEAGEVLVDGAPLYAKSPNELAFFRNRYMGFIFQFHHLLKDFDAEENVAMPLLMRGENRAAALQKAAMMLERVGLQQRRRHRPGELSGGEQQRVAIARALVGEPRLLFADEPTGNLDRGNAEQIQNLLLQLNAERGCTLVVVTHNEVFAKKTKRTVWLNDGKITHSAPAI